MMIRGATPTLSFVGFPFPLSSILNVRATFSQNGAVVLQKAMADIDIDSETGIINISLTQTDTLEFTAGEAVVELKFLLNDGNAVPIIPLVFPVYDTTDEEVIR